MEYEVWAIDKKFLIPAGTKTFHRYQEAKKYAKRLALKKDNIKVWIYGRELIKGPKYL